VAGCGVADRGAWLIGSGAPSLVDVLDMHVLLRYFRLNMESACQMGG
jgi:hypothetical protein